VEHHASVDYQSEERCEILLGHQAKIAGELNVALEFIHRRQRVPNVSREFARTGVGASLDNVRRHRHRGAHELIAERGASDSVHLVSHSIRIDRDLLCSLPNAEFPEVAHATFFMTIRSDLPSFARAE